MGTRHAESVRHAVQPELNRHALGDPDAERIETDYFARAVREQANGAQAQVGEDLRADAGLVLKSRWPSALE